MQLQKQYQSNDVHHPLQERQLQLSIQSAMLAVAPKIPLLIEKFKINLARVFEKKQQDEILSLSLNYEKLAATPVNEFMDLLVLK